MALDGSQVRKLLRQRTAGRLCSSLHIRQALLQAEEQHTVDTVGNARRASLPENSPQALQGALAREVEKHHVRMLFTLRAERAGEDDIRGGLGQGQRRG